MYKNLHRLWWERLLTASGSLLVQTGLSECTRGPPTKLELSPSDSAVATRVVAHHDLGTACRGISIYENTYTNTITHTYTNTYTNKYTYNIHTLIPLNNMYRIFRICGYICFVLLFRLLLLLSQTRLLSLSLSLQRSVPASPYLLQNEYSYYYYDTSTPSSLLPLLPGVVP